MKGGGPLENLGTLTALASDKASKMGVVKLAGKGPKEIDFVVCRENTEGLYVMMGGHLKKDTPDANVGDRTMGGTVAPVAWAACVTLAKIGMPSKFSPAFLGWTPATNASRPFAYSREVRV